MPQIIGVTIIILRVIVITQSTTCLFDRDADESSHAVNGDRVLENQTERLATRVHELFYVHRFMLNLFAEIMPPAADARHLPDWLKRGLAGLEDIETMQGGAAAFAQLCGRSPEHVARECRRLLGDTPTTLVNQARLAEAARQLRMSNHDILSIMYECGFTNSSHFYSLFKKRYGVTPRDYRIHPVTPPSAGTGAGGRN
ncbi:MAG: helix-turn-helix transcriptional regulator [Verrucomicrobia bacterium]|nr:helix-turn-helix transcriptional regulator [Verrucomicrobiota bacterium]